MQPVRILRGYPGVGVSTVMRIVRNKINNFYNFDRGANQLLYFLDFRDKEGFPIEFREIE